MVKKILNYLNDDNVILLKHKKIKEFKSGEHLFEIKICFDSRDIKNPFYFSYWVEDGNQNVYEFTNKIYNNFKENLEDVDGGCGGGTYYRYDFNENVFLDFLKMLDFKNFEIIYSKRC